MYNEIKPGLRPINVKVQHGNDYYYIYTDEYEISGKIKQEIALLKNIPFEFIRLYYKNKRVIEDHYTNHDQEIYHGITIYASFKSESSDFEPFSEISVVRNN